MVFDYCQPVVLREKRGGLSSCAERTSSIFHLPSSIILSPLILTTHSPIFPTTDGEPQARRKQAIIVNTKGNTAPTACGLFR